ncbi:hypothetical protein ATANTOWER_007755 [Ataeniobius toweri]|uniref:Uncharacterized protein n=1 Tax=Ataeniobius toweri TaxID=208326 RepID=A0ABU7CA67_9TELE|nr:hypothetical protein [Ataeniobius toweri]
MISTARSDLPQRSELTWARPSAFPQCGFPQHFLFHSPNFSRPNFCSTRLQPLLLTKPTQTSPPTVVLPPKHALLHSWLPDPQNKCAGRGCTAQHPVSPD